MDDDMDDPDAKRQRQRSPDSKKADLLSEVQLIAFKQQLAGEFTKLQVYNMDRDELFEKLQKAGSYTKAEYEFAIRVLVEEQKVLDQDGDVFLCH